jgi:hypothetical protein
VSSRVPSLDRRIGIPHVDGLGILPALLSRFPRARPRTLSQSAFVPDDAFKQSGIIRESAFSPPPLLLALEYVKASNKTRGKEAISSGCVSQIIRLIKAKESKAECKANLFLIPSQNVSSLSGSRPCLSC